MVEARLDRKDHAREECGVGIVALASHGGRLVHVQTQPVAQAMGHRPARGGEYPVHLLRHFLRGDAGPQALHRRAVRVLHESDHQLLRG